MAQATKHLRDLLEKIKGDTERALALLPSVDRAGRMMNQFSLNYSEVGQLAPNHLARERNAHPPALPLRRAILPPEGKPPLEKAALNVPLSGKALVALSHQSHCQRNRLRRITAIVRPCPTHFSGVA